MAQQRTVQLVDDVDGSPATESVVFGLEGVGYEIDLNDEHATELRASLDLFVQHARKVGKGRQVGHRDSYKRTTVRPENGVIRSWAEGQGIEVSSVGRISNAVIAQYEAAH